jgi:hypothetical protein
MIKATIPILLLMSIAAATTLTVDSWQMGYGAQEINDSSEGDMSMFGGILGFVVLAGAFAYLHTKSNNWAWRNMWLCLSFVMAIGAIMGANAEAIINEDTANSGITIVMFQIMFWILIIIVVIFIISAIRNGVDLIKEAAYGKKKT